MGTDTTRPGTLQFRRYNDAQRRVRVVVATIPPASSIALRLKAMPAPKALVALPVGLLDRILETVAPTMRATIGADRELTDSEIVAATVLEGLVALTIEGKRPSDPRTRGAILSYLALYPR